MVHSHLFHEMIYYATTLQVQQEMIERANQNTASSSRSRRQHRRRSRHHRNGANESEVPILSENNSTETQDGEHNTENYADRPSDNICDISERQNTSTIGRSRTHNDTTDPPSGSQNDPSSPGTLNLNLPAIDGDISIDSDSTDSEHGPDAFTVRSTGDRVVRWRRHQNRAKNQNEETQGLLLSDGASISLQEDGDLDSSSQNANLLTDGASVDASCDSVDIDVDVDMKTITSIIDETLDDDDLPLFP